MEDSDETVPLPKYLLEWLRRLEAIDVAGNAHKISDERWLDFKEQAANLFHSYSQQEKNDLMVAQGRVEMTVRELFGEEVDEEREVLRIVQKMCIVERNKGRQGISVVTLHGPNDSAKSFTFNRESGKAKPLVQSCAVCGVYSTDKCGGCEMFYYCGREHQKLHWIGGHNKICKTLKRK